MVNVLTGAQLRAARALLNMSVVEISEQTGLAVNTVRRAESTNGPAPITAANMNALRRHLEDAGVVFVSADEHGAGVRFRSTELCSDKPRRRRSSSNSLNDT